MMDSDLTPIPASMRAHRDNLRVAGYDLLRLSLSYAAKKAASYRHDARDYEYSINKIEGIYDHQAFVASHGFACSAADVPGWAKYHIDQAKPESGTSLAKNWFKDNWLLSVVAAPYSLALLDMSAVGERQTKKAQGERATALRQLKEMPKIQTRQHL